MIDDDIKYFGYYEKGKLVKMCAYECEELFENAFRMAKEMGTKLWGLNLQSDKKFLLKILSEDRFLKEKIDKNKIIINIIKKEDLLTILPDYIIGVIARVDELVNLTFSLKTGAILLYKRNFTDN